MAVDPIPADYPRLSPYLVCAGAAEAIEFYREVFGFEPRGGVMTAPDGKIGHAELVLGDSVLMLADEWPDEGAAAPTPGATGMNLHLYVEDVDAAFASAVARGSTSLREPTDQFYGDRSATIDDPWGHRWNISTHVEDVSPEEMAARAAESMG